MLISGLYLSNHALVIRSRLFARQHGYVLLFLAFPLVSGMRPVDMIFKVYCAVFLDETSSEVMLFSEDFAENCFCLAVFVFLSRAVRLPTCAMFTGFRK